MIGDFVPPSNKKIKAALHKASIDLAQDKEKYLNHIAMNKAKDLHDNKVVTK